MKKNKWLSNTKVVDANGNPLILYHGSEVAWRKYDSTKAPDTHSTYGNSNHIYFSSKKEVAETYLESYPVFKDVPLDKLRLFTMYKDEKNNINYFAECDINGIPTGKGLKPKLVYDEDGYYFDEPLNGIIEPIPNFNPTLIRKFQYLKIMNQPNNGQYDISDFKRYASVHHNGDSFMRGTNTLKEDIIYSYQHGEEYHFEPKGVVRPFYVNLENPFIIDAQNNNSVCPFTDENGHTWGHTGEYSYQRYTPVEAIEDYAKKHGYDAVHYYLKDSNTFSLDYSNSFDAHFNDMLDNGYINEIAIDTYLEREEYVQNKELELFHDYSDSLEPQMESFLEEAELTPSFKDDFVDHCLLNDQLQDYLNDNLWHSYIQPTADKLGLDPNEVHDYIIDNYSIDENLEPLIDNTKMPTIAIYVGKTNWDDSYFDNNIFELTGSLEQGIHAPARQTFALDMTANDFKQVLSIHSADELQENLNKTMIPWLVQTQGYTMADFYDNEKIANSKFLSSLHKDMKEMSANNFVGYELVFVAGNTDVSIDTISDAINENGDIALDKDVEVGFHNRVHGYSTGQFIELEQPVVIPNEYIQRNMVYDSTYTPNLDLGLYPNESGNFTTIEGKKPIQEKETDLEAIKSALLKNERQLTETKSKPVIEFTQSNNTHGIER